VSCLPQKHSRRLPTIPAFGDVKQLDVHEIEVTDSEQAQALAFMGITIDSDRGEGYRAKRAE
jgi:hypothetical protein